MELFKLICIIYISLGIIFTFGMIFTKAIRDKEKPDFKIGEDTYLDAIKCYALAIFLWWLCLFVFICMSKRGGWV
ncbi:MULTISPECIES: hypothetical protein [Bacillus]|uniref:Uncharacterized protein n=2 Tax=Bacillus thuringiensis TaxID=1428 RepID=A0AAP4Q6P5_BACTU|nr:MULTISPECIES: hypothetical protein [Bacillus]MEC0045341.1 hypothetical protein [Bacillus cereus]HDR7922146.1 hypothetical protein [Bacillus paranthracis]AFV21416.1 hypothetical protein BTB_502p00800 [Bacillus thuringiensis Bt407]ERI01408.1 hypothetical protein BTCBT_002996 [Bacillus thuringiensis T01-328]MDN7078711.1 hypothetical protein [Bacillus thuringiensis]